MLTPFQLQIISDVYYHDGFVLGRDKLYQHLQQEKNPNLIGVIDPTTGGNPQFTSRDDVENWLTFQPVNTIHMKQRKPRKIDSFKPRQPFHSLSVDLIDYSKNGSASYDPITQRNDVFFYILIIIDNYSRYMWAVPLVNKRSTTVGHAFWNWYINHYTPMQIVPPIFVQVDNGGEFVLLDAICIGLGCHVVRSLPHVPQSNALVERSIGTLKRIMAKLIHIRHQSYIAISNNNVSGIVANLNNKVLWQSWYFDLDKALSKYNNTVHGSHGHKPIDAINVNAVTPAQYNAAVAQAQAPPQRIRKAVPVQHDYNIGQFVRLIKHKGRLGKYDKLNWSSEVYIITNRRFAGNINRRTKYEITLANNDQTNNYGQTVGVPLRHMYYKEHLNGINI